MSLSIPTCKNGSSVICSSDFVHALNVKCLCGYCCEYPLCFGSS